MPPQAALVGLCSLQGRWRELLSCYRHMLLGGLRPDTFIFPILLKSCPDLRLGEALHADAAKRGLGSGADPFVSGAIIDMYCRCGGPSSVARTLFDEMPEPKPVVYNVAISSFFRAGRCVAARLLFDRMPCPNDVTWSAVVAGYTQNGRAQDALMVHGYISKISNYVEEDEYVGSVLLDVYGKCDCLVLAGQVFDSMVHKSVVAWSSLISNFVHGGNASAAIRAFKELVSSGATPNDVTLTTALSACAHIPSLANGKELHGYILRRSLGRPEAFVSCALMDMYGKCGSMISARSVFEKDGEILGRHVTPMWNTMISGYIANSCLNDAWHMIRSMCQLSDSNAQPNSVTLAVIFPLCAASNLLHFGKELHCYALKSDLDRELLVGNSLLDMYCKCGKIIYARNQFDLMPGKNRISWTTLIDGYGMHGNAEGAINIFERMVGKQHVDPDPITFVGLISACSHSGLVEDGLRYFKKMTEEYGISPTEEVCGCMVDLLARAGRIYEAKEFMAKMPTKPSAGAWGALLGACRIHGEIDDAESTIQHLFDLEHKGTGFHTLLSNMYAERGMVDEVAKVRNAMTKLGIAKRRGYSRLEAEGSS
ncbi:hypothetical protein Taro_042574 [Colocasia esculenta]|uniref:Pentatricopeptide repeat-containing protein n=1 Tax=Colocasia esculenta TaxID=4460 RepID=A0A843X2V5_COLES|nr:hypothetical protein [Colocasia esculenta]